MKTKFLTANWKDLIIANYEADPAFLKKHLPYKTELDFWKGKSYVSLVGFMFQNTKVKGFEIPFHQNFEEVNLRFYVKYNEDGQWKRGVTFIKEIVPLVAITFVANQFYNESYATFPMRHFHRNVQETQEISYYWKLNETWDCMKAITSKHALPVKKESMEEFISEHYWGYTKNSENDTSEYAVEHPVWQHHPVIDYDIDIDAAQLYGIEAARIFENSPNSVFLFDGSPVSVGNSRDI
jgi:hypothetical protein